MTKTCSACGVEQPLDNFGKSSAGHKHGRKSECKPCDKARQQRYHAEGTSRTTAEGTMRRRKRDYVWEYLLDHPCVDCGERDPVVLQFDHHNGDKAFEIGRNLSWGCTITELIEEINKCQVVCANCHWRRTDKRRRGWKSLRAATCRTEVRWSPEPKEAACQEKPTPRRSPP